MIYRLDADQNGTLSIQEHINAGRIINLPCPTFNDLDKYRIELQKTIAPGDWVVLDTLTRMLETTRADRVLGWNIEEPLWTPEKINKYFGDKEALSVYRMSKEVNLRVLSNLRARGAHILCLCHEDDVKDPMAQLNMAGPAVSPAVVGPLIAASTCVFRIVNLLAPIVKDGVTVADTDDRIIYLRRTSGFTAKYQTPASNSRNIPSGIVVKPPEPGEPYTAMQKLFSILKWVPDWVTIYGYPGAGKTSLAGSLADFELAQQQANIAIAAPQQTNTPNEETIAS